MRGEPETPVYLERDGPRDTGKKNFLVVNMTQLGGVKGVTGEELD